MEGAVKVDVILMASPPPNYTHSYYPHRYIHTRADGVRQDMEMPVMDGNTATVKIREMERSGQIRRHVPIMGISANARPEQVAKMTEVGMVCGFAYISLVGGGAMELMGKASDRTTLYRSRFGSRTCWGGLMGCYGDEAGGLRHFFFFPV
jgi:hypothetical protein